MLADVIWDPALLKTLLLFENVQKFALRICSKQWDSSYDALLNVLTVPTLSSRRKTQKLVHRSVFLPVSSLLPTGPPLSPLPHLSPHWPTYLKENSLFQPTSKQWATDYPLLLY